MKKETLQEVEDILLHLKHAMIPQDMETTIAHGKKIDALDFVIKQAKQSKKYRTVIRHLENAYQDMSDDETIGQDDWLGGWAAAVDFIEENIDWEETDEAKTIVEENKELSDRVQELEKIKDAKIVYVNKGDEESRYVEQERIIELETQIKHYRKAVEHMKSIVLHPLSKTLNKSEAVYKIENILKGLKESE